MMSKSGNNRKVAHTEIAKRIMAGQEKVFEMHLIVGKYISVLSCPR